MRKLETVLSIIVFVLLLAFFLGSGNELKTAPVLATVQPSETILVLSPTALVTVTARDRPVRPASLTPKVEAGTPRGEKSEPSLARAKGIYSRLLAPVWQLVQERRGEWLKDPAYLRRVNPNLNQCRLNVLLFSFGETHEPGLMDWGIIGSQTIVSVNLETGKADLVSFTHDIWAPELRSMRRPKVSGVTPVVEERISEAYFLGGFPLVKQVMEDASGLSVDLTVVLRDGLIADLVREVFDDQLPVYIPEKFTTYPYWLDKVLYPAERTKVIAYDKGVKIFSGREVVGLIKAVPVTDSRGEYPKSVEHNRRKEWVLEALKANAVLKAKDPTFWSKSFSFLLLKWAQSKAFWFDRQTKSLDFDFEAEGLSTQMLASAAFGYSQNEELAFPEFGKKVYIVDGASGDGGVRWTSNFMEIPLGSINADGDLVKDYWTSVRNKVEELLTTK